jgi:hypothetical protein
VADGQKLQTGKELLDKDLITAKFEFDIAPHPSLSRTE